MGTSNTIHVSVYLRPNSMQPALDVYSTYCELVTCGCDGQRSRRRDGPILSVSSIISIIVAFTGRPWRGERYDGTSTRTGPLESKKKLKNRIER